MIRALLWQVAQKGKPASLKILNVQKLLGQEPTKSRVVFPAAGLLVTSRRWNSRIHYWQVKLSQLRRPEMQHWPAIPRGCFFEIDKNLIVINGDIFEHLAPEMMCPAWLYEEMVRVDTLICGSQTVVDNMFDVRETETERCLNDDFNAPHMANMLRVPIFSWPVKPKAAGDPTTFDICWLLKSSPESCSRKVSFPHYVRSLREASRKDFSLIADSQLSDVWTYSSRGDGSCRIWRSPSDKDGYVVFRHSPLLPEAG